MQRTRRRDVVVPDGAPHRTNPALLQQVLASVELRHAAGSPGQARPRALLGLQQRGGNHAVQRLVTIQRTEAEAIAVAKAVYAAHGAAPRGYEGGRVFGNFEGKLPRRGKGGVLRYWEYDVHRLPTQAERGRGITRDAERVVIDNNWVAWYTADHYQTFKKITY